MGLGDVGIGLLAPNPVPGVTGVQVGWASVRPLDQTGTFDCFSRCGINRTAESLDVF